MIEEKVLKRDVNYIKGVFLLSIALTIFLCLTFWCFPLSGQPEPAYCGVITGNNPIGWLVNTSLFDIVLRPLSYIYFGIHFMGMLFGLAGRSRGWFYIEYFLTLLVVFLVCFLFSCLIIWMYDKVRKK